MFDLSGHTYNCIVRMFSVSMTRAIVIDDDVDAVEVFGEFLEIKGVEVIGKGYNGLEGVNLYKKLRPDIVFADVMMPEFDGFYLLSNIKKINSNAKVVMVTADLREETKEKLTKLCADGIIYKPFEINYIINLIRTLIKEDEGNYNLNTHVEVEAYENINR